MKTISVEIKGTSPLLIHRYTESSEAKGSTRKVMVSQKDPREEAQKNAYIAEDGTYYFSAFSIPGCMANAGSNHKMVGSRKTLRFIVPSAIRMTSDTVTILDDDGNPATSFEVDCRPVTIPATKGRILRYRPRWNTWRAKFDLVLNEDLMEEADAHRLLTEAGVSIGIGDFRPEKRGPFGCFRVLQFG